VRSKAWVCGRLMAGLAGLNAAEVMDIHLVRLLFVAYGAASATSYSLVQMIATGRVCPCVIWKPQQ